MRLQNHSCSRPDREKGICYTVIKFPERSCGHAFRKKAWRQIRE
ncbi:hypothetical protein HMPREF1548_02586 [Clostridium sp. KLE 1755]|nr:hypothetical protein HMPREF1548_02586 [Clostridium sp. KLE 1755]